MNAKATQSSKGSELLLLGILVVLVGFARVYHGGPSGNFMFVWKGEFGFHDTIVDLDKILHMSRPELEREHRDVMYQLENMGLLSNATNLSRPMRDSAAKKNSAAPVKDPDKQ